MKKRSKWYIAKKVIKKMVKDLLYGFYVFVEKWLPKLIDIMIPFMSLILGAATFEMRGQFSIGSEWGLVALLELISYLLKRYARQDRIYNEFDLPIPAKRFTQNVGGGEYQVDTERLQEMILYVADVEDWLKDNDLLEEQNDDR